MLGQGLYLGSVYWMILSGVTLTDRKLSIWAEVLNPTTLVIRRSVTPVDPPSSEPLVLKEVNGNIPTCAGCFKPITPAVAGYLEGDDQNCYLPDFKPISFGESKQSSGN